MSATWTGSAWSCAVRLAVLDARKLDAASRDLQDLLDRVDRAASRFRDDSELSRANDRAGRPTPVSRLLVELVDAGLGAAAATDGAVDPTLGRTLCELGYDRDFATVRSETASRLDEPRRGATLAPSSKWSRVRLDRSLGLLTVPRGAAIDLGATAKAWTADAAARVLSERYSTGVLVELGGDLAVAGPTDGWRVRVAERAATQIDDATATAGWQVVVVRRGGVATSTTTVRRWSRAGQSLHHVIDPATGRPAEGPWRTASVWAPSALEANIASTAAIVRGDDAVTWLTRRGFAARLVSASGVIVTTPGWPRPTADQVFPPAGRHFPLPASPAREDLIESATDASRMAGARS